MKIIGIDIGTTHCKAGLFDQDGTINALARCSTPTRRHVDGAAFYQPDELWAAVATTIAEAAAHTTPDQIAAIGIASMAETGLLIERRNGEPRTPLIPWFDTAAASCAERIALDCDRFERFCTTGQYPGFKSTLARLLYLHDQQPRIADGATWLFAADYVAYRLSGAIATDYSLATRSYAFRIDRRRWDEDWLQHWGFTGDIFAPAALAGTPIGEVQPEQARQIGVAAGTPVAIAGHDHVAAALAVGAIEPGSVFDSIGTAETLVGALPAHAIGQREYDSRLGYGCHVVADRLYWMGGISASGGSIEWLRALLADPALDYADLLALIDTAGPEPTGILYLPYLLGSGTPHADATVRGALIGLSAAHGRAQIAKAVLEGTAYELEFIRRTAEQAIERPVDRLIAAGGGTRNRRWMQIKTDVCGCAFMIAPIEEAAALGAALVAGIGCGVYRSADDAIRQTRHAVLETYIPDHQQHTIYRRLYERGFEPLQQPLRRIAAQLAQAGVSHT